MSRPGVQELFDRVAERLLAADSGVESGRMFGSAGLKTAGKVFAMTVKGELVVKLPAERVDAGRGARFDPGHGRRLREWVGVRPTDEAACEAYVTEAREFVEAAAGR